MLDDKRQKLRDLIARLDAKLSGQETVEVKKAGKKQKKTHLKQGDARARKAGGKGAGPSCGM